MRSSEGAANARRDRKGPLPAHSPKYRGKGPDERPYGHAPHSSSGTAAESAECHSLGLGVCVAYFLL